MGRRENYYGPLAKITSFTVGLHQSHRQSKWNGGALAESEGY